MANHCTTVWQQNQLEQTDTSIGQCTIICCSIKTTSLWF